MCSGDQALFESSKARLALMGKASHFLGEEFGQATKMKLVVNSVMANMLGCLGEGLNIATQSGISTDTLLEVMSQGAIANPMFALKVCVCNCNCICICISPSSRFCSDCHLLTVISHESMTHLFSPLLFLLL